MYRWLLCKFMQTKSRIPSHRRLIGLAHTMKLDRRWPGLDAWRTTFLTFDYTRRRNWFGCVRLKRAGGAGAAAACTLEMPNNKMHRVRNTSVCTLMMQRNEQQHAIRQAISRNFTHFSCSRRITSRFNCLHTHTHTHPGNAEQEQ